MDGQNQGQLKGWVLCGRTINTGRFNSVKIELGIEFILSESNHEKTMQFLNDKITKAMKDLGLVQRYD